MTIIPLKPDGSPDWREWLHPHSVISNGPVGWCDTFDQMCSRAYRAGLERCADWHERCSVKLVNDAVDWEIAGMLGTAGSMMEEAELHRKAEATIRQWIKNEKANGSRRRKPMDQEGEAKRSELAENLKEDWCGADRPKYRLAAANEITRLKKTLFQGQEEICQRLGRVLKYPWYKDDQKNFSNSTEADGVCVGDHTAETLAAEAAKRIESLERELAETKKQNHSFIEQLTDFMVQLDESEIQAAAMREALELLCAELSLSMPDKPREFQAENIWDACKKAHAALSTDEALKLWAASKPAKNHIHTERGCPLCQSFSALR